MEGFSVLFLGITFLLYIDAFFLYLYHFFSKREVMGKAASYLFLAGFLTHTLSLAFRWGASGHLPGIAIYESFSVVAWFITGGYLFVEYRTKLKILGLFTSPVVSLFLIQAALKYKPPAPPIPLLKSSLVDLHFTLIYITAAALTVAGGSAFLYLLEEWQMKKRKSHILVRALPPLEALDEVTYQAVIFGFPFLTLVITTGFIRAIQQYGSPFNDVVVLSRLISTSIVWIIYLSFLTLRIGAGWGGRKTAILALTGFLGLILIRLVVITYLTHLI